VDRILTAIAGLARSEPLPKPVAHWHGWPNRTGAPQAITPATESPWPSAPAARSRSAGPWAPTSTPGSTRCTSVTRRSSPVHGVCHPPWHW